MTIEIDENLKLAIAVWERNRRLKQSSITVYCRWIKRFEFYCHENDLDQAQELTLAGARRFAKKYAHLNRLKEKSVLKAARSALFALSTARRILNPSTISWDEPVVTVNVYSPLIVEYATFLSEVRGNPESTIKKKSNQISHFLSFLKKRNRRVARIRLIDIDAYVLTCGQRYARITTADICSTIRSFLGFLHTSDRISANFSTSVVAPRLRRGERPPLALPWDSVQLILRGIDRSDHIGCRDYAILLMMSIYGLGAGETIRIMLEDIRWRSSEVRVVRPKTGVEILLPLLPVVAEALVDYLKHSRPVDALTRNLFVSVNSPFNALKGSGAIRHILVQHAHAAGITGPNLGSHALRHSHACRQMEIGTPMTMVGDILGHRDPASTSAYIRISTNSLREMALAVPQ